VRLDSGTIMKTAVANVTRLVERPIAWDERVWLTWAPEGSHGPDALGEGAAVGGAMSKPGGHRSWSERLIVLVPYLWLTAFFLLPS